MTEHLPPQHPDPSIRREIYTPKIFYVPDVPQALEIGGRLTTAMGIDPEPATLVPEDYDSRTEDLTMVYSNPAYEAPGWHDSRAHVLSLTLHPEEEAGVSLWAGIPTNEQGAIAGVQQAAGAPVQALPRELQLRFARPEDAIAAASDLHVPDVQTAMVEQARRSSFAALVYMIGEVSLRLGRGNDDLIAYLREQAPHADAEITAVAEQARQGTLNPYATNGALKKIAIRAYVANAAEEHTRLIETASDVMRLLYARPEWQDTYRYPHTMTFGAVGLHAPMSVRRLEAQADWKGAPIDSRLAVATKIRLDGTYDLRNHTFRPAERGNGAPGWECVVTRAAVSPDNTEAALGDVMDEQLRAVAGRHVHQAAWEAYMRSIQEAEVVPLTRVPNDQRSRTALFRHPALQQSDFVSGFHH